MKRTVLINIVVFVNCVIFAVGNGSHSLVFLSTGRTKSQAGLSFEQLTVFDGITISYCDSHRRKEQLKPVLQTSSLPERCDEAHDNIIESFLNIQQIANFTVDVVQRRRGCSQLADDTVSGFEAWAVNGEEFLTFDPETLKWTSKNPSALGVEELWSSQEARARSYAFSGFIRNFCPKLIQQITLKTITKNTELHVFAKQSENGDEAQLRCHVTTTDKSVKSVRLIGDGAASVIYVSVMGPVPSGDGAVIRLRAGIFLSHSGFTYGCTVHTENHNITVYWNGNTLDGRYIYYVYIYKSVTAGIGYIAIITVTVLMGLAMRVLHRYIKIRRRPPPPPPRPELRDQFEHFIQSPTMNPVGRNIILSFSFGTNIPDRYQNAYEEWLEMVDRENYFDPEFSGGQV